MTRALVVHDFALRAAEGIEVAPLGFKTGAGFDWVGCFEAVAGVGGNRLQGSRQQLKKALEIAQRRVTIRCIGLLRQVRETSRRRVACALALASQVVASSRFCSAPLPSSSGRA